MSIPKDQNPVNAEEPDFKGEVKVASRIVDALSSGLYKSPAACLKELVNNSYDADATTVKVFIKPDADRVIIEDDGCGINREEFVRHFELVAESHKRDDDDVTERGRPKIGKIGIGFLAANEICNRMEIISTKEGSDELLRATLRFDLMRKDPSKRRRGETALAKGDFYGVVESAERKEHYTKILLKEIRGPAQEVLAGASGDSLTSGQESLYGLGPKSIRNRLAANSLKTWDEFDAYSKTMLRVGLNVPVGYHDGWAPDNLDFSGAVERVKGLNFKVYFDGSELRKPIVFTPPGQAFVEWFDFEGDSVSAEGYFYAQHTAIKPQELQGLLVRIRNAAVGEYDASFLGFSSSIGPLFQKWISAEIWADNRLEDAMNIDRRTLREAHPAFVELQSAIHLQLKSLIKRVRKELFGAGSKEREERKVTKLNKEIRLIASEEVAPISKSAADEISSAWAAVSEDEQRRKVIVKQYSVADLYDIVINVADEVLSRRDFEKFIARLTERLTR